MTTEPVIAELRFWLEPDDLVPEAEVPGLFAAAPERFPPPEAQTGHLVISAGTVAVTFGDTLLWLLPQLCFDVPVGLAESGTAGFESWGTPGEYGFRLDGVEVEITGSYLDPLRLPAPAFQVALVEAGLRYLGLLERLWPEAAAEDLPRLRDAAAAARAALGLPG